MQLLFTSHIYTREINIYIPKCLINYFFVWLDYSFSQQLYFEDKSCSSITSW